MEKNYDHQKSSEKLKNANTTSSGRQSFWKTRIFHQNSRQEIPVRSGYYCNSMFNNHIRQDSSNDDQNKRSKEHPDDVQVQPFSSLIGDTQLNLVSNQKNVNFESVSASNKHSIQYNGQQRKNSYRGAHSFRRCYNDSKTLNSFKNVQSGWRTYNQSFTSVGDNQFNPVSNQRNEDDKPAHLSYRNNSKFTVQQRKRSYGGAHSFRRGYNDRKTSNSLKNVQLEWRTYNQSLSSTGDNNQFNRQNEDDRPMHLSHKNNTKFGIQQRKHSFKGSYNFKPREYTDRTSTSSRNVQSGWRSYNQFLSSTGNNQFTSVSDQGNENDRPIRTPYRNNTKLGIQQKSRSYKGTYNFRHRSNNYKTSISFRNEQSESNFCQNIQPHASSFVGDCNTSLPDYVENSKSSSITQSNDDEFLEILKEVNEINISDNKFDANNDSINKSSNPDLDNRNAMDKDGIGKGNPSNKNNLNEINSEIRQNIKPLEDNNINLPDKEENSFINKFQNDEFLKEIENSVRHDNNNTGNGIPVSNNMNNNINNGNLSGVDRYDANSVYKLNRSNCLFLSNTRVDYSFPKFSAHFNDKAYLELERQATLDLHKKLFPEN